MNAERLQGDRLRVHRSKVKLEWCELAQLLSPFLACVRNSSLAKCSDSNCCRYLEQWFQITSKEYFECCEVWVQCFGCLTWYKKTIHKYLVSWSFCCTKSIAPISYSYVNVNFKRSIYVYNFLLLYICRMRYNLRLSNTRFYERITNAELCVFNLMTLHLSMIGKYHFTVNILLLCTQSHFVGNVTRPGAFIGVNTEHVSMRPR